MISQDRVTLSSRSHLLVRATAIVFFALLTAAAAKIAVPLPFTPVPITLQVATVLLAGLVLGPVDGFLSQALYLGAVAGGLPLDTRGLGTAALLGPTTGYLLGFAPGAATAGWLGAARGAGFVALLRRLAGALAGVVVVYGFGTLWLAMALGDFAKAIALGVAPFILVDLAKAILAAAACSAGATLWPAVRPTTDR